jgi:hypothetical protein
MNVILNRHRLRGSLEFCDSTRDFMLLLGRTKLFSIETPVLLSCFLPLDSTQDFMPPWLQVSISLSRSRYQ